jgi:hypothetical protein
MGILGSVLSAGSSAVSGFGIGTWIKIAGVLIFAAVIGGLYWYGQHEAGQVVALQKETGAQQQIIADDKANIGALTQANKNWADAFKKYQQDAANQQSAFQQALALKEKINAQLASIEKLLATNPQAAAAALNSLSHRVVCLLDAASGRTGNGCPSAAPGASGAPAPSAP